MTFVESSWLPSTSTYQPFILPNLDIKMAGDSNSRGATIYQRASTSEKVSLSSLSRRLISAIQLPGDDGRKGGQRS